MGKGEMIYMRFYFMDIDVISDYMIFCRIFDVELKIFYKDNIKKNEYQRKPQFMFCWYYTEHKSLGMHTKKSTSDS